MNAWLQMLWSIEVTSKLMNILCALKKNTLEFTWSKKLWSYWIISVADPHYALMLNYVHWFLRLQYDYGHQYTFCALLYQSPDTLMRNSCHLLFLCLLLDCYYLYILSELLSASCHCSAETTGDYERRSLTHLGHLWHWTFVRSLDELWGVVIDVLHFDDELWRWFQRLVGVSVDDLCSKRVLSLLLPV